MDSNTCTQKSPKNQGSDLQLIWLQLMSHRRRCAVLKDAQVHYLQLLFPNADLYCVKGASNSFLRNLDGRRRLPSTRKDVYGPGYTIERFGDFAGDAWFPKLVRRTQMSLLRRSRISGRFHSGKRIFQATAVAGLRKG